MATFIGREQELETLVKVAQAATTGHGRLALVEAPAGGGKTALLKELVRRLADSPDAAMLNVACGQSYNDYSVHNAFQPFAEALSDLAGAKGDRNRKKAQLVLDLLGGSVPELLMMLPVVGPAAAIAFKAAAQTGSRVLGATEEPRSIPLQFAQAFTEIADKLGPILIVVEDMHWCDLSSIALLKRLARTIQHSGLSVVVSYRPPRASDQAADRRETSLEFERVALELRAASLATYVPLKPFGAAEIAEYITVTYGAEVADQLAEWLSAHCGGQPLFVAAYLTLLEESGRLRPGGPEAQSPVWVLDSDLDSLPVPDSIEALLKLRAGAVKDTDHLMLQVAAVQGQEFLATVLASLLSVEETEVVFSLQAVREQSGVIAEATAEDWARDWSDVFSFEHQLMQRTFYRELSHRQQVTFHKRIGEALRQRVAESVHPPPRLVLETARHLKAGEEWGAAAEHFRLAARSSYFVGALAEGASLAETGLSCIRASGRSDTDASRLEARLIQLLMICSELAWWTAPESIGGHDVMTLLANADAAAARAGDEKLATELTFLRAKVTLVRSSLPEAIALFEKSAQLAHENGDALGEVISRTEVGHHLAGVNLSRALEILHEAHRAWETDPRLRQETSETTRARHRCRLEGTLGTACFDAGRFDEAEHWAQVSLAGARQYRLPDLHGHVSNFYAQLLIATGRFEEARELLEEALSTRVTEGEAVVHRGYLRALLGKLYLEWGRPGDAVPHLTNAWEQTQDIVNTAVLPLIRNYYCELLLEQQVAMYDPQRAQRLAKQTLVETSASGFARSEVAARMWLAVANRRVDHTGKALQWAASAVSRLDAAGGVLPALRTEEVYFVHSQCATDAGQDEESAHSLERAHAVVMRKATSIADAERRSTFLGRVRLNRDIVAAWSTVQS